ncbi:MAG: hypothetical protein RSD35_05845 [Oscillospiraceae bacterium]
MMFISYIGILISLIITLPNVIYFILPVRNRPVGLCRNSKIFNAFEIVGRVLCIASPVFSGFKFNSASLNIWFWLMSGCIVAYYCLWFRYVFGNMEFNLLYKPIFKISVPMAVFLILAFIFAGLWIGSKFIICSALIFGIGHYANSIFIYEQCTPHQKTDSPAEISSAQ